MKKRIIIPVCALLALLALVAGIVRFNRPTVRLEATGAAIVVRVETLGEYPTTIRHILLKNASSGAVVFELVTENGTPQIHNFLLSAGANSITTADPQYGSYRAITPASGESFVLRPGVDYRIEIWGTGWLPSHADLKF